MARFIDDDDDSLFRSHFAHANRLADRAYEQIRAAYRIGQRAGTDPFNEGCAFDEVEKDLENGWLNVRVGCGDWGSVREFAIAGFDRARQGRIPNAPPTGSARSNPPYADPLAQEDVSA